MANCQATLHPTGENRGRPLRLQVCGTKAVVKTPPGFFEHGRQVWFCADHAPTKLLPRTPVKP